MNDDLDKQVVDSTKKVFNEQKSFNQQILILSATVLGIVVAFQDKQSECLYIRLLFVSSIVLFALGILMLSITLYEYVKFEYRRHYALCKEVDKIKKRQPFKKIISVNTKKVHNFAKNPLMFF